MNFREWWRLWRQQQASRKLAKLLAEGKVPRGRTDLGAGTALVTGTLEAVVHRADGSVRDLGVISTKCITDAFVAYVVDAMQSSSYPMDVFKWHACGTGTTAESSSDTTLGNQVGSRVSGTQTEASSNVYQSVATISFSGSYAITEHGLFSASSGGTLADRSVFSAINVANGDSIQFTFTMTFASGG